MQINTKFSIGDKAFFFQRDSAGNLMSMFPVVIASISIKDAIEYYSLKTMHCIKEENLFTIDEALEELKKLCQTLKVT